MIRKLLMLCMLAVAAAAVMAPGASARTPVPVHVEAEEDMIEVTGDGTLAIQFMPSPGVWIDVFRCDNHWEADLNEDGFIHVHNVELDPSQSTSDNCEEADDCPGVEWNGQIHENEGGGEPEVVFNFCTTVTGAGEMTCDIGGAEMHCYEALIHGSTTARVNGEVFFNHALTIVDAV